MTKYFKLKHYRKYNNIFVGILIEIRKEAAPFVVKPGT